MQLDCCSQKGRGSDSSPCHEQSWITSCYCWSHYHHPFPFWCHGILPYRIAVTTTSDDRCKSTSTAVYNCLPSHCSHAYTSKRRSSYSSSSLHAYALAPPSHCSAKSTNPNGVTIGSTSFSRWFRFGAFGFADHGYDQHGGA